MALRGPIRPETRLPLAAWHPLLDTLGEDRYLEYMATLRRRISNRAPPFGAAPQVSVPPSLPT